MTNTTYYNLNIVEGTDIVNPLTVDNPNYEKIDETMHNNAVAGVTLATEIANATVHAITRENSDCAVIRFIATSRWKAGDTATVDGVPVTALLPSGETLPDGAYVINANVLCILTGTNLTFYLEGNKVENASDIKYNDTNVKAALDELNTSVGQINGNIEQINSKLGANIIDTTNVVDLTKHTSDNPYIFPHDGYINLKCNPGSSQYGSLYLVSNTGSVLSRVQGNSSSAEFSLIFVKQGMKGYGLVSSADYASVSYAPIIN